MRLNYLIVLRPAIIAELRIYLIANENCSKNANV
jgi:hypothetical protein